MRWIIAVLLMAGSFAQAAAQTDEQYIRYWQSEWPDTDFSKRSVDFDEIKSGGPSKDGIPPIDEPEFRPVGEIEGLEDAQPVMGLIVDGEAKAYPLSVLMWHEIVNDEIAGVPVAVTFCPLCNAAIVFDRRLGERVLDFGTTGKLRNSDLVMWDRQTESWWQQFLGEAIVGELTGARLEVIPSRVESFARFRERAPGGQVLVPGGRYRRNYGQNPYVGYDTLGQPWFWQGEMPDGVPPLMRVVSLGERGAWTLELVRTKGEVRLDDGTVIRWTPGQFSALDANVIAESRDVGNVTVIRDGADVAHGVDFAFAYHAFYPDAPIRHLAD
ncbi:DUF3179 domain-containing protein [Minwuia thermotolerans]|uniref:DUF3179 domain-containing protein n=1 Tax=Minwuia thermotolerans TaxID=2056226 RepID=A0A2M9G164_9PROT|nr:DUF3179 domain-containing protein [Minwuia thermotolerans]PJK29451.1 hypothetical protein CVT23_10320 [Minwuia thermotolerans]